MILYGNGDHVYGYNRTYFGIGNANLYLDTDGHGAIFASITAGQSGETAQLYNTASAGYQFNGYTLNGGGSIVGDVYTFGDSDATAYANFAQIHNLTLTTDGHGKISSNKSTGISGDTVTLSQTASANYAFMNYTVIGGTINGSTFTFSDADATAQANYSAKVYTITLQNDGHGTLSASKTTATANQTVTLSPEYNTYYRFNNYSITGGSVNGNTLTVTANCTAKANFKVNAFTASGGWEKGSNVSAYRTTSNVSTKYAITSYKTSNTPTAWCSASNRWKPNGASAYSITLHPVMKFSAGNGSTAPMTATARAITLVGSTQNQTATITMALTKAGTTGATKTGSYNKTFNSTTQNVNYGISANVQFPYSNSYGTAWYIATGTTGTWTATGYAP